MPAWIPVLKTVLPYLTTIVTTAVPAFHARKEEERVTELQEATRQNAESTRLLAEQMQRALQAIEAGGAAADRTARQTRWISVAALIIALVALAAAFVVLLGR